MDDLKQLLRASAGVRSDADAQAMALAAAALDAKDAAIRGLLELIDEGARHEPQVVAARAALDGKEA